MSPRRLLPLALLAAFALLPGVRTAHAACAYNLMTGDVTYAASATPTIYQYTQSVPSWSAVGVRPAPGDDWDISVYGATAPDPTCVTSLKASSTQGVGVLDFVIGDFNYNPEGTYYPVANHYSGSQNGIVQWDTGADYITPDTPGVTGSLAANDLLRVWDVNLAAGTTYTFRFYPDGGSGAHLLLFRNTLLGTYWVGRSSAQFDVTSSVTFTAPASGFYGVVLANDAATYFNYALAVTSSPCGAPITLNPGTSTNIAPSSANMAFDANASYWMGVGIKPSSGDWDTQLYGSPAGGTSPTCFSNLLATSQISGSGVDITITDFNTTPLGWYYEYPYMFSGGAGCQVQYTGSLGVLNVNDDMVSASMAATDVAHARDVYLLGGHTYALAFAPTAGITLLLFANPGGGPYHTARGGAAVQTTTSTTYTAPANGWYGLVVVNDAGAAGSYSLGVGDCSAVTPLAASTTVYTGLSQNAYFSFNQTDPYWTAVAVRNTSADWDLFASQDDATSPFPACATLPLASSSFLPPVQDFVVGDFNYNTFGTYYLRAHQYTTGPLNPAQVEWDTGPDYILPNDNNFTTRATGPNDLIGCWDVLLNGGQTYQFTIGHSGGADLHLLLFRNPASGTYWAGRAGAAFTTTSTFTYTPPTSAFYGVVAVNDNGVADNYWISVQTCDPIVALSPAPAVSVVGPGGVSFDSFAQPYPYWTPVAIRGTASTDWDIAAYQSPTGGPIGTCMSNVLASSQNGFGFTDYVIGDFNFVPTGTYYVRGDRFMGANNGSMQWFQGGQQLAMNAAHQVRSVTASFMVESWDALLTAGQQYSVFFSHDPGLDVKVDVFPSAGVAYWGGRANALFEDTHSHTFTAPTTGWYGVVVVNDGGSGTYNIGIAQGVTAVDGAIVPERTAFSGVSPNPGRAGMRLAYALHEPGDVSFDVIDMAGRLVSKVTAGERGTGTWSEAWSATDAGGQALAPGIYFVRMWAGARVVGTRKVTLLE